MEKNLFLAVFFIIVFCLPSAYSKQSTDKSDLEKSLVTEVDFSNPSFKQVKQQYSQWRLQYLRDIESYANAYHKKRLLTIEDIEKLFKKSLAPKSMAVQLFYNWAINGRIQRSRMSLRSLSSIDIIMRQIFTGATVAGSGGIHEKLQGRVIYIHLNESCNPFAGEKVAIHDQFVRGYPFVIFVKINNKILLGAISKEIAHALDICRRTSIAGGSAMKNPSELKDKKLYTKALSSKTSKQEIEYYIKIMENISNAEFESIQYNPIQKIAGRKISKLQLKKNKQLFFNMIKSQSPALREIAILKLGRVSSAETTSYLRYVLLNDPVIKLRDYALRKIRQPHINVPIKEFIQLLQSNTNKDLERETLWVLQKLDDKLSIKTICDYIYPRIKAVKNHKPENDQFLYTYLALKCDHAVSVVVNIFNNHIYINRILYYLGALKSDKVNRELMTFYSEMESIRALVQLVKSERPEAIAYVLKQLPKRLAWDKYSNSTGNLSTLIENLVLLYDKNIIQVIVNEVVKTKRLDQRGYAIDTFNLGIKIKSAPEADKEKLINYQQSIINELVKNYVLQPVEIRKKIVNIVTSFETYSNKTQLKKLMIDEPNYGTRCSMLSSYIRLADVMDTEYVNSFTKPEFLKTIEEPFWREACRNKALQFITKYKYETF